MRQILLHGTRFFPPKDLVYFWLKPNSFQRHRRFFLGTIFPPKDLVFFLVEQQAKDLVFSWTVFFWPKHRIRQLFYSWITSKPEDLFNLVHFHWPLLKAQNNSSISKTSRAIKKYRKPKTSRLILHRIRNEKYIQQVRSKLLSISTFLRSWLSLIPLNLKESKIIVNILRVVHVVTQLVRVLNAFCVSY